ncbi:MAG TPA: hypothetical protein VL026_06650 [Rhizomicrobium sp.]|nr:hypothetical protein [Rhizomicrobium sp.]
MPFTPTIAYRVSLAAGLLLLAVVVYSALLPAMTMCGGLDPSYQPIVAFELARSVSDLQAIFGSAPGACRDAVVAQFTYINMADDLLFIPLYGIFLVFFFLASHARHQKLAITGVVLVVLACLADYIENACLFRITQNPDVPSYSLALLPWATGVKWMFLAIPGALAGYILSLRGGWRWIIAGLTIAGAVIVALAMADPASFGRYAASGVTISWAIILIADAIGALRTAPSAQT